MPPAHGGFWRSDVPAKLLTKVQQKNLLKNGEEQRRARDRGEMIDFRPVVKLFTPDAQATWLLSELYPGDPDVAFGLCDLGMGFPELGDVRIWGCTPKTAKIPSREPDLLNDRMQADADLSAVMESVPLNYTLKFNRLNVERVSNNPPAKPGALEFVSRSKQLNGVANAAPRFLGHLKVAGQRHRSNSSRRLSSCSWRRI
jgi:hypothetical protein